ncbi:hypothetical protein E2562_034954 [Oryza meyeriana var. granulata]|uniref:Disease resistance N-terminal domain-containing protein n=1 Tax=Oryza meyeriana var. granulata TaxID=110450 RepID=A0A6G1DB07_9ORYZ|nr:hypothetical protein E2562_034954 [Oryza meyeriana var. granulata]
MATVKSAFLVDLAAAVKGVADDKMAKAMGVADEAHRLKDMMAEAAKFAGGAEEREMQDALWVHKLREVAFHVEDAVDTYALHATARKEMDQSAKKSLQHIELGRTSKIEELHLKDMPELEVLSGFEGSEQPRLREFGLEKCHNLDVLPAKFKDAERLTRIEIRHANSLQVISDIPALEELVVEDAPELTEITSLAALKNMIHRKLEVLLCILVFVYSILVLSLVILKVLKGR